MGDKDISWEIRTRSQAGSSLVSRYLCVRDYLLEFQRELARRYNVVMEEEILELLFCLAREIKIYLTGKTQVRAKRRMLELQSRGEDFSFEKVVSDIETRDKQDMERPLRPLEKAADAIKIDTSDMTIEEVVDVIVKLAKKTLKYERSKEVNNLKPVKGEQLELKQLERASARRKRLKKLQVQDGQDWFYSWSQSDIYILLSKRREIIHPG